MSRARPREWDCAGCGASSPAGVRACWCCGEPRRRPAAREPDLAHTVREGFRGERPIGVPAEHPLAQMVN